MPVLLDSGCTFSIMTKHVYDTNQILHKCLKLPADIPDDSNWKQTLTSVLDSHSPLHSTGCFSTVAVSLENTIKNRDTLWKRCFLPTLMLEDWYM